jgi:dihydropteroate synthase
MLHCGKFRLSLQRPLFMGIVNVTPDSFSDGGRFFSASRAVEHGLQLVEEGADILDVGGESTRPGAGEVGVEEELERVLPVLDGLRQAGVPLSIDTMKPPVMAEALEAGAAMVNDVRALREPGALKIVGESGAAVCLMHMQGAPRSMQQAPRYTDVVGEVKAFLRERVRAALEAGIVRERLVIDPGFGFGKTLGHNLELLRRLDEFADLKLPLLAGLSRKSMIGALTGAAVEERVHGSVAAALLAVQKGARIVRVHDVKATRDALAILEAVEGDGNE